MDTQKPDLTCTLDSMKTRAYWQVVGVENVGDQHMAKQLDSATSITSTQNNRIYGFHFIQHTTFNTLNDLIWNEKRGLISV